MKDSKNLPIFKPYDKNSDPNWKKGGCNYQYTPEYQEEKKIQKLYEEDKKRGFVI